MVLVGYQRSGIEIVEITEHVFPGLERFITIYGEKVKGMDVAGGWAGFGFAGKAVGWWVASPSPGRLIVVQKIHDIKPKKDLLTYYRYLHHNGTIQKLLLK